MMPYGISDFGCMLSVGANRFEDRFCASKKLGEGEVDGFTQEYHAHGSCLREKPWSEMAGPFLTLLAQTGSGTNPLPCRGTISESVGSFQSGGALAGRRALTIESSPMSKL